MSAVSYILMTPLLEALPLGEPDGWEALGQYFGATSPSAEELSRLSAAINGLNVLIYLVMVWVIYMISAILMNAAVGGILAGGFFGQGVVWPSDVDTVADLQPMLIPLVLTAVPFSIGFGWVMALYAAPSVVAARQLLDGVAAHQAVPAAPAIVQDAPRVDALQPS
ncbi:hypothetical protein [Brevundimonas sp. NIBR11]|uniref:hypothetical protein n=1 Tax=Brevundimonas sp. NIBR11 TaxID=3015999 RepID=UPI0022F10909|nr:hypothetical protein [Brevundimonas sp. NIBR11]WGM31600.1 hypothetical protein KKHFBJBL_01847 [Brevundimonas sp. NIBR11]